MEEGVECWKVGKSNILYIQANIFLYISNKIYLSVLIKSIYQALSPP